MLTEAHRLDEMDEGSEIQSYLLDKTGQRTVPNIFISEPCQTGLDGFGADCQLQTRSMLVGAMPSSAWRARASSPNLSGRELFSLRILSCDSDLKHIWWP